MKNKIIYILVSVVFVNQFVLAQTNCGADPTSKKYMDLVNAGKDVQFNSMCAALALYKCECESGNLNAEGVKQALDNIKETENNLNSAYTNQISTAGKGDASLWRTAKCKTGENKNKEGDNVSDRMNRVFSSNGSEKEIATAAGIVLGVSLLQSMFNAPPTPSSLDKVPSEYSCDFMKKGETRLNGINTRKMVFVTAETFATDKLMIPGEFTGNFINGFPENGVFTNTNYKSDVAVYWKFSNVKGAYGGREIQNGNYFVVYGLSPKGTFLNGDINFAFSPNEYDTITYNEKYNQIGQLTDRSIFSKFYTLKTKTDELEGKEELFYTFLDGTTLKSQLKKLNKIGCDHTGESVFEFPNGDKFVINMNDPLYIPGAAYSQIEKGEYYTKDGTKINESIYEYALKNPTNSSISENALIVSWVYYCNYGSIDRKIEKRGTYLLEKMMELKPKDEKSIWLQSICKKELEDDKEIKKYKSKMEIYGIGSFGKKFNEFLGGKLVSPGPMFFSNEKN